MRLGLEDVVMPPDRRRVWWDWSLVGLGPLGVALVAALTALPWGAFYLVRWIIWGFVGRGKEPPFH